MINMIPNNENMKYYTLGKEVPNEAKTRIEAGNLKGYTDVNPMWRIKVLTEMFGPVGIGWKTKTVKEEYKENKVTNEISCFVSIELYIKVDGEWSEPIEGSGGSMFTVWQNKQKWENGKKAGYEKVLTTNDEALKMAKTDALSVCCKMLGIAADVYFEKDRTKYDVNNKSAEKTTTEKTVTKKEVCNKQEYLIKVKKILWEVSGKNKEKSIQLLKEHTTFIGKDNKEVPGVTDFEKLSIPRLQVTYGNLKKLYPQIAEKVKKEFEIMKNKAV